ncbi:MAG: glycosyltransferase, partial [Oscillospiraceae bacterium]
IDRYAAKDSRIRAVHQQNQKLPKTLSNGFEIAKGEYFTWTSADNVMHRDFVQKLVDEMNAHPETDMVYANIRLIDEKGEVINDNKWYPDNACPENVLLPHCILELNTYANNFVAAAFMYKASVAHALSSAYSTNRYTTEDYDYWMRVNEMFNLRHVSFNDAIYDYRFHSKSLTAQDKELKISENRYRLMLWEDFRRGYLLKPMNWVVDCENKNDKLYKSFIESITIAGHNIIDKKKAAELCQSDYTRAVYINFDAAKKAENYIANAYNICVCDEPCSDIDAKWDCLISRQEVNCGDFLAAHKGWFSFANGKAMFAYITRKAKDAILFHLETAVEQGTEYKKDISIVLTYDVDLNALRIATMSLTQQDYPLDAIEVVVVSTEEAREEVLELFDTICQQKMLPESFFRFVATDANNFTERNNCGAWASTGKYIAFMDSLTYVEPQYIKNIFAVFTLYPKAAAVCGSV